MLKIIKSNIGMRTCKTALAVFLCIIVSTFFGGKPIYACIAALISMESTVINSYTAGVNRMKGTMIGVFLGLVFSTINIRNPLLISLGTIIIITFCNKFNLKKAVVLSNAIYLSIMLNIEKISPLENSFYRLTDTFVGIVISVLVNYLLFPPKLHDKILKVKEEITTNIRNILSFVLLGEDIDNLENLNSLISDYNTLVSSLEKEQVIYRGDDLYLDSFISISKSFEAILIYFQALTIIKRNERVLSSDNLSLITKATGIDSQKYIPSTEGRNTDSSQSEENIIFNYNIKKALEIFNKLV